MQGMQRHSFTRAAAVFALLTCAAPASAQWIGKGEAGMALASGNTDTKSANAKVAVTHRDEAWEQTGTLAGLYVRSGGDTTARRWEVAVQARYSFSGDTFWFGAFRHEEDRFSGFDHQGVVNTGIGQRFVDNDRTKLRGQLGVGFKFAEPLTAGMPSGTRSNDFVGVAQLDFEHKLNESTSVFNRFGAESTTVNNFLQNDVGVSVKMSDRLALAVAYGLRHNTDPPPAFKKTDTLSTINLVYEVK